MEFKKDDLVYFTTDENYKGLARYLEEDATYYTMNKICQLNNGKFEMINEIMLFYKNLDHNFFLLNNGAILTRLNKNYKIIEITGGSICVQGENSTPGVPINFFFEEILTSFTPKELNCKQNQEVEPKNNDNRTTCFWCNSLTKHIAGISNWYDICSKCRR